MVYTVYAVLVAWLFDDRGRRLLLAEAMHAFAAYLRAKAALYNPDTEGPGAFRALIDAHAALADRLQAARDSLFARRSHRMQLKRIDTLIALLDAFETVLSSDADLEALRGAPQRELMWRLNEFVGQMAEEVERLTLALRFRHGHATPLRHAEDARQLQAAVAEARDSRAGRSGHSMPSPPPPTSWCWPTAMSRALAVALDDATAAQHLAAELDLDLFRQDAPRGVGVLLNQFRWRSRRRCAMPSACRWR